MRELAGFILFALSSTFIAGCSCTEVGCEGGLWIHINAAASSLHDELPVTVNVCADKDCGHVSLYLDDHGMLACSPVFPIEDCNVGPTGDVITFVSGDIDDPATASIEIKNSGGDTLFSDSIEVDTKGDSPNGPFCGSTCYSGDATFTPVSK